MPGGNLRRLSNGSVMMSRPDMMRDIITAGGDHPQVLTFLSSTGLCSTSKTSTRARNMLSETVQCSIDIRAANGTA